MYSYIALMPKTPHACEATLSLERRIAAMLPLYSIIHKCKNLIFFHAYNNTWGRETIQLHNNYGIIAGTVFKRANTGVSKKISSQLSEKDTNVIVKSMGRSITRDYWGNYVSIVISDDNSSCTVISDPSGIMPVYIYVSDDYVLIFSEADHFSKLNLGKLSFNKNYIAAALKYGPLSSDETGIEQITKLRPGESLNVSQSGALKKQFYWKSSDYCKVGEIKNPRDAAEFIKETTIGCVQSWGSMFNRILHRLSGGLDSSIVLASLMTGAERPNITCVNYFSDGASADERKLARLVAQKYSVKLIEIEQDPSNIQLSDLKKMPLSPEMPPWIALLEKDDIENNLLIEHCAESIFDGEGGDALFHQYGRRCVDDYFRRNGFGFSFIKESFLYGRMTRQSVWNILSSVVQRRNNRMEDEFRSEMNQISILQPLISKRYYDSIDISDRYCSWMGDYENIPLAKTLQAFSLHDTPLFLTPSPNNRYLPVTSPLFSQPLIEAILQIPTHLFCWPGVDRGLARYAFKDLLPPEVILRQSKGAVGRFRLKAFEKNREEIVRTVLNGSLSDMGLLDKERFTEYTASGSASYDLGWQLLALLQVEHWLKSWSPAVHRSPVACF